eukprot:CAMPEP_0201489574 /NCGR_PEP_ID=MMETSP0151_2-20130828/22887_1 /ASSEMBLY_ACC=CAM_ASM_000257 /TAXON_ID=200890 /ORGANISM="Paramoeba atlantica, Strain 621/1 / CCAP 1560/9" /LENGTH=307 /DNA_ID=CAMNT_0047875207 /DNA_START=79 /DNA_END=1002 /DNA_ORIENTATION=-
MSFADADSDRGAYQQSSYGYNGSSGFASSGGDPYGTRGLAPGPTTRPGGDAFGGIVEQVTRDLRELTRRHAKIESLSNQIAAQPTDPQLRVEMNRSIKEAQQMAKNTNQSIRQLTKLATSSASKEEKQVEKRLKKEFQEWLKRFQTFSKQMVDAKPAAAPAAPEGPMSGYGQMSGPMSDYNPPPQYTDALLQEEDKKLKQVQLDMEFNESLIADRETEILQIEQSMNELNEIFRDLNTVVHDQQSMIDNIDENISSAHSDVHEGVEELTEAKQIQKKSRFRICLLVCIVVVLICLVVAGAIIYTEVN